MSCFWWPRAALIVLAHAGLALAAEDNAPSADPSGLFSRLDANRDGQLSTDEVTVERKTLFERLVKGADKNADGRLNLEEFTAGLRDTPPASGGRVAEAAKAGGGREAESAGTPNAEPPRNARPAAPGLRGGMVLRLFDADRDGKLSAEEIEQAPAALKKLDRNSDGVVTAEEIVAALPAQRPAGASGTGLRTAMESLAARLKEADKNGDGKISKSEAPQRLQRNFDRLDKNSDGELDADELKAVLTQARERRNDGPNSLPGGPDKSSQ